MQQTSMTALVSLFARAYHTEQNPCPVFRDPLARQLLTDEEYRQISAQMAAGISFFAPGFHGTEDEALRHIVDHQLAPSPLGRAAFAEEALERAVAIGARQYCLLGAGYDTFAYRQPAWAHALQIFELDRPAPLEDKRLRLGRAGLEVPDNVHFIPVDLTHPKWQQPLLDSGAFRRRITFCSLLGLVYYLPHPAFAALLAALGGLLPEGSSLVFDYPDAGSAAAGVSQRQEALAAEAGEPMAAGYTYREMERLLEEHGFLIYEHLLPHEITHRYFSVHNQAQPLHPMEAFPHVNYCLAIRRGTPCKQPLYPL